MGGKTLTRADLSDAVHQNVGLSRTESADLVKSILDHMTETLVGGETVKLSSFGTPRRVLVFRPSHVLKDLINAGGPTEAS
jgi:integration host factor subunit alpha